MIKFLKSFICLFIGHNYKVEETFKRIGTNEYYKIYVCKRCGKIKHMVSTNL